MAQTKAERHITFFTVGNGNSALISLNEKQNLLFDLNCGGNLIMSELFEENG